MKERSNGCSVKTLLPPCASNKRLQRKMTKGLLIYKVGGLGEIIGARSTKKYLSIRGVKDKNWKTSSALGTSPHETIEKYLQKTDLKSIKLAKAFLHEDS